MPNVVISFVDGEVLYAETPEIAFELPVIEAEVRNVDPNSERALFPLSAIRQMIIGDVAKAPDHEAVESWDRAAFHFVDGQVLRASIAPDARLGRYGGIWTIVEPNGDESRTLAIPYTALKGVYQVRQWDSRPVAERSGQRGSADQLARILAERDALQSGTDARPRQPLMSRVRRNAESSDPGQEDA